MHYHSCPECYEKWQCSWDCTIEPDLTDMYDDGREFGSHCTCPDCDKALEDNKKYQTKEFWDIYNGFTKVKNMSDKLKQAGVSIHVIATGGGAGIQSELWSEPGSSAYFSGASFPYAQEEQEELLGFMPKHFCSEEASIDLASAAYMKAYRFGGKKPVGLGITASVASTEIHRGDHRVFGCIITDDAVLLNQYTFFKATGEAARASDGLGCDLLGENLLIEALGLDETAPPITTKEKIALNTEKVRERFFQRPFFAADGKRLASMQHVEDYAMMAGTFNPPHEGHYGLADSFRRTHGRNVVFEIGTNPPHKAPPTVQDLLKRAKMLRGRDALFSKDIPMYLDKARAFPKMPLLIGADTMVRMLDPKWGVDIQSMLEEMTKLGTTFYVSGREIDGKFTTCDDIVGAFPYNLLNYVSLFKTLKGRWDISSSQLRAQLK